MVVCDYLRFGWPIGYDYHGVLPSTGFRNHRGALDFPCAVDSYLSTELALSSVCGPFARNPFVAPIALSPLNSVPKPDSDERRFILDLSWPAGSSVNDGISKEFLLGQPVSLTYPTVRGRDNYSMRDSLSVKPVYPYTCDCEVNFLHPPYPPIFGSRGLSAE